MYHVGLRIYYIEFISSFGDWMLTCLEMIPLCCAQGPLCCPPRWPVWNARVPSPAAWPVQSPPSGSSPCRSPSTSPQMHLVGSLCLVPPGRGRQFYNCMCIQHSVLLRLYHLQASVYLHTVNRGLKVVDKRPKHLAK